MTTEITKTPLERVLEGIKEARAALSHGDVAEAKKLLFTIELVAIDAVFEEKL